MERARITLVAQERDGRALSTAEFMRAEIASFRNWRCHYEPDFNAHFMQLQIWQVKRLKMTHQRLLEDERYCAATEFFLSDMYGGLDLTELANEVERALPLASKLLPDSVLRTSGIALELNSLTGALDQRMTEILFEEMSVSSIDDETYCEAYRLCSEAAARERQLHLVAELGLGLDRYVRSRVIYATFKMSSRPAHMAGLGGLYDFLGRGFDVMRPMGSASDFIHEFADVERRIMQSILLREPDPFAPRS